MPVCISVEGKYVNLVKSCKFKVGFSQVSAVCEVAVSWDGVASLFRKSDLSQHVFEEDS